MDLLDIFKKKPTTAKSHLNQPSVEQEVDRVYRQTGKQIVDGLNKPNASTGKPIDELHGAAKRIAQMSNIGGGSKVTGGGGLDKGLDTVTKHAQAKTAKAMLDRPRQKNFSGLGTGKTSNR